MQPNNAVDLVKLNHARALLDKAIAANPNVLQRLTMSDVDMIYQSELDTQIVSVRMSKELVKRIDQYAREQAYRRDERMTRSSAIVDLVETAIQQANQKQEEASDS